MAGLTGNVAMVTSGIQYAVFILFTGVMWYVQSFLPARSALP